MSTLLSFTITASYSGYTIDLYCSINEPSLLRRVDIKLPVTLSPWPTTLEYSWFNEASNIF